MYLLIRQYAEHSNLYLLIRQYAEHLVSDIIIVTMFGSKKIRVPISKSLNGQRHQTTNIPIY